MQGWFHGYRDALVKCRLTPGGISSSCGTAGSLRFTCFSTSGPEFVSTGGHRVVVDAQRQGADVRFLKPEPRRYPLFLRLAGELAN